MSARGVAERLAAARRDLLDRVGAGVGEFRSRNAPEVGGLSRGLALIGTVWAGGATTPFEGVVVLDARGAVTYLGAGGRHTIPAELPVITAPGAWIGPGIVDAHVHLARAEGVTLERCLRAGVVALRDLGAPPAQARLMSSGHRRPTGERPVVATCGPIVTAPNGFPGRTWGQTGFASSVLSPSHARQVVQGIATSGADVIKIALERGEQGWPVPGPSVVRAVVEAAHDAGLAVVAHALTVEMVRRAVEAGVDELAHTPTERLPEQLVERIAELGISVVSTLQTFFSAGVGRPAADNAAALYQAGVVLRYGTDLGNVGTRVGVDPRELDRLADTGLGRLGALRAATEIAAQAPGIRRRSGLLQVGHRAALVVLPGDPLAEPGVWRSPRAIVADGRLLVNGAT